MIRNSKGRFIKGTRLQADHHNWKGDNVGYKAVHEWVRKYMHKSDRCDGCCINKPKDLANVTNIFTRNFYNWVYLCAKCHSKLDSESHMIQNIKRKK